MGQERNKDFISPLACTESARICQSEYYITLKLHHKSNIVQGSWMNTSPTCAVKLKRTSDSQFGVVLYS